MRYLKLYLLISISLLGCKTEDKTPAKPIIPSLLIFDASDINYTSAVLNAEVINDGSSIVTEPGFYLSETNTFAVLIDIKRLSLNNNGKFSISFDNLKINTKYFYKAVASKPATQGISGEFFSEIKYFTTKALPKDAVLSSTGRIWMDRNLGATRVATSSTDEEAFGDLYQWGRPSDGHQLRTSATTFSLSSTDVPGNALFVIFGINSPDIYMDWRKPQNNNLWQGVNGINCPCPQGYRIPTSDEWLEEFKSWKGSYAYQDAFNSPLKLPMAGLRGYYTGNTGGSASLGVYWTSTIERNYVFTAQFDRNAGNNSNPVQKYVIGTNRSTGASVRCIKD